MANNPYKYARTEPPFNFLGNFSITQREAFKTWTDARKGNFPAIQQHHQIRAQQLRKAAGLLEEFYGSYNDQSLSPSFNKEVWKPGQYGHFTPRQEDHHLPMVVMSKVKARFKEQLQRDDEGMFFMNHTRYLIEKHEDEAQYANEILGNGDGNLKALLAKIDGYFSQVEYESVLVDDTKNYKGQPYFRVHPLDTPTRWELEQMNHGNPDEPILLKEEHQT